MLRFLVIISFALLATGCGGPLGPFAGGELSGEEQAKPPTSWAFAKDVEVVQLETSPSSPYSVNVWIGVVDDRLYVPTSLILGEENPNERAWVQHVSQDPAVRVRIDGTIYRAQAVRVTEDDRVNAIKAVLLAKYEEDATQQSNQAWVFELQPR